MSHRHDSAGRAVALAHGAAHDQDHATWSRRDFLVRAGAAAATAVVAGRPVHALAHTPLLDAILRSDTDRILVLLQLGGGNDGLNTVVPVTNDLYYQARPTLALAPESTVAISADYGLHPALAPLEALWGEGRMGVVHSVGYPDPDLSHFRGTDIWLSASDADETLDTGWTGRAFDTLFPDFDDAPTDFPPAVQIGTSTPLLFRGAASYGMALSDIETFLQVVSGEPVYDPADVPPVAYGAELAYLRTIANDSFRYAGALRTATAAGQNTQPYPDDDAAQALAATARLIKGGLGTRIYLIQLSGFDTHADQAGEHAALLDVLARGVAAFTADLGGHAERVLTMTFSEFGRRVEENGSGGTDHGTAAPLLVFGEGVAGGFYGDGPGLGALDDDGNLVHAVDFRQVYAAVLRDWFALPQPTVDAVLGGQFAAVPFLSDTVATAPGAAGTFGFQPSAPNPFRTFTDVRFTLARAAPVRLDVFDALGRRIATLVDGERAAGAHAVRFEAGRLPAGVYVCRLEGPDGVRTQRLTRAR